MVFWAAELPALFSSQGINHGLRLGRFTHPMTLESLKGTVFQDPSFGSSSISTSVAKDFMRSDRVMLEITVSKGAKGGMARVIRAWRRQGTVVSADRA